MSEQSKNIAEINALTLSRTDPLDVIDYVEISEAMRGDIANIVRYKRGSEPSRARRRIRHGDSVLSTVRPARGARLEAGRKNRLFQVASANPNWVVAYAAGLITANTTARGANLKCLRWTNVDLFEKLMDIPDIKGDAGKRRIPLNPEAMLGFLLLLGRAN